jgi:hypothetical protein
LASEEASNDKLGTIMKRHLDLVISGSESNKDVQLIKSEDDSVSKFTADSIKEPKFEVLTSVSLRNIVKQFSGKKLENDAIDELLLLYYDYASSIEFNLQKNVSLGDVNEIRQSFDKFEQLMMLGWMRRILKAASEKADSQGSNLIKLDHIVAIDPWS